MKVYLAADHAGFELKEHVKKCLTADGHDAQDCGAFQFDPDDDYPDFVGKAALGVSEHPSSMGIVFGLSGAGECIVANKTRGVRAVLAIDEKSVRLAREHNNANVLCLGSAFVSNQKACELARLFLATRFSGEERHARRISKIKDLENRTFR